MGVAEWQDGRIGGRSLTDTGGFRTCSIGMVPHAMSWPSLALGAESALSFMSAKHRTRNGGWLPMPNTALISARSFTRILIAVGTFGTGHVWHGQKVKPCGCRITSCHAGTTTGIVSSTRGESERINLQIPDFV